MRKKDYELIGSVFKPEVESLYRMAHLKPNKMDFPKERLYFLLKLTNNLANEFEQSDPKFDRNKFLTACGICQHHNKNSNADGIWCLDCGKRLNDS